MAIKAADASPAPTPLTSLVSRNVDHAAKAENTGAVKTHTVSTERGMLRELAILGARQYRSEETIEVRRDWRCLA